MPWRLPGRTTIPVRCLDLSPLFALTRTPGVCTNNSQFGTYARDPRHHFQSPIPYPTKSLFFHILSPSFSPFCTSSKINSFLFKPFPPPFSRLQGVGWPSLEPRP